MGSQLQRSLALSHDSGERTQSQKSENLCSGLTGGWPQAKASPSKDGLAQVIRDGWAEGVWRMGKTWQDSAGRVAMDSPCLPWV